MAFVVFLYEKWMTNLKDKSSWFISSSCFSLCFSLFLSLKKIYFVSFYCFLFAVIPCPSWEEILCHDDEGLAPCWAWFIRCIRLRNGALLRSVSMELLVAIKHTSWLGLYNLISQFSSSSLRRDVPIARRSWMRNFFSIHMGAAGRPGITGMLSRAREGRTKWRWMLGMECDFFFLFFFVLFRERLGRHPALLVTLFSLFCSKGGEISLPALSGSILSLFMAFGCIAVLRVCSSCGFQLFFMEHSGTARTGTSCAKGFPASI